MIRYRSGRRVRPGNASRIPGTPKPFSDRGIRESAQDTIIAKADAKRERRKNARRGK